MPVIEITQSKDVTIEDTNFSWNLDTGVGNLTIGKYASGYGEGYVGAIRANSEFGVQMLSSGIEAAVNAAKTVK